MKISKSKGITDSEKVLSFLCEKSFLSLWSYPNLYKDKGKELCDNLVVFDNNLIIFSDKAYKFHSQDNLRINWNRWYKHAIFKSCKQLYGAERWIKNFPHRIFIDNLATQLLPIKINFNKIRIYRVAIAIGARQECIKFYQAGSGSLRLSSEISPIMQTDEEIIKAFTVGNFPENKFVHILDDLTVDIILKELNTIEDFVSYLEEKEKLFKDKIVLCPGEEDLLAFYLQSSNIDENCSFKTLEDYDVINFPENIWDQYKESEKYKNKVCANQISYNWDKLIEHYNNAYNNNHIINTLNHDDYEIMIRDFASLNRLERRAASESLEKIIQSVKKDKPRFSCIHLLSKPHIIFAFINFPRPFTATDNEYNQASINALEAYSNVLKLKFPQLQRAQCLLWDLSMKDKSERLFSRTYANWTSVEVELAKNDLKMLGLKLEENFFTIQEFPK